MLRLMPLLRMCLYAVSHISMNRLLRDAVAPVLVSQYRYSDSRLTYVTVLLSRPPITGLHKEHLESFVMGHPSVTAQPEEAFEHRLIEEELSLQLSLLSEQMPKDTLFPEESVEEVAVEETIKPLHADSKGIPAPSPVDELVVNEGKAMMMLDEETLEAAVICLVIGGLAVGILNI